MGAGASAVAALPERVDEAAVQAIVGPRYSREAFLEHADEGTVPREVLLKVLENAGAGAGMEAEAAAGPSPQAPNAMHHAQSMPNAMKGASPSEPPQPSRVPWLMFGGFWLVRLCCAPYPPLSLSPIPFATPLMRATPNMPATLSTHGTT